MNKFILLWVSSLALSFQPHAQKGKDKKDIADSTIFLNDAANRACQCIDSVDKAEKDKTKKVAGVPECIDRQVEIYQLSSKLTQVLKTKEKSVEINLVVDKKFKRV
jgi:hypothetical protein